MYFVKNKSYGQAGNDVFSKRKSSVGTPVFSFFANPHRLQPSHLSINLTDSLYIDDALLAAFYTTFSIKF
jgi:hypothetical protein